MQGFRAAIRVRPGARVDAVGGSASPSRPGGRPALIVQVRARPVDGAASAAAERVLADALRVRHHQVSIVRGAASRDKLVVVSDPPPDIADRWTDLLDR